MYKVLICLLLWTCNYRSNTEAYKYKDVPKNYLEKQKKHVFKLPDDIYDLTRLLPVGYVKDGSIDYTEYLQYGLSKYKNVLFPNFPLLIGGKGLTLTSNSTLYFTVKTILVQKPNALRKYEVLRVHNIENVKIYNPKIRGDRNNHKTSSGEWGMGIAIRSSENITIFAPDIRDCWGDGIYIGQLNNMPSRNITIFDALIDNNRRNGISITSVERCQIIRPIVSNTNGTLPGAGIDIEANSNNDEVNGIILDHPITFNNTSYGIVIGLAKLLGEKEHKVNVRIHAHVDELTKTGFFMGGASTEARKPGKKIIGEISVESPMWVRNEEPLRFKTSYGRLPNLVISKPKILHGKNSSDYLLMLKEKYRNNSSILIE